MKGFLSTFEHPLLFQRKQVKILPHTLGGFHCVNPVPGDSWKDPKMHALQVWRVHTYLGGVVTPSGKKREWRKGDEQEERGEKKEEHNEDEEEITVTKWRLY